jgi:hypothetical protein
MNGSCHATDLSFLQNPLEYNLYYGRERSYVAPDLLHSVTGRFGL